MENIIREHLNKYGLTLEKKEKSVIARGLKDWQHLKEIMKCLKQGKQPGLQDYLIALRVHKAAWKTVLYRSPHPNGDALLGTLEKKVIDVNKWLKTRTDSEASEDEKREAKERLKNLTDKNEIEFMHDALLARVRHEATDLRTPWVFQQILKERFMD